MLNKQADDLEKIHFENYLNESKQLFESIENNYSFANEDIELLWRSSFNMMRQVFYPPEGNLSNNYYVFSREPIWGVGPRRAGISRKHYHASLCVIGSC